ncbi:MAG: thioredoxin family protein [Ruminococcus flavefaciens]|nr:thioredoxin family protein [Ruminococcus flavefaciens]MCM1058770.1 thioredoxin family protein [Eubacterium sp.]
MDKKKSLLVKIIVPVLMIGAITGMWIVKSHNDKKATITESEIAADLPDDLKDADFSLNEITAVDYEALFEYGIPIIVDYGSDSCIPCKQMAPVLETLNEEMTGKAFIKFVDVWKYSDAANDVPVQVIPTQILFNADGTPFLPSDELASEIEFSMYSDRETNEHVFTTHQGGITEEQMRKILKEMGVE